MKDFLAVVEVHLIIYSLQMTDTHS